MVGETQNGKEHRLREDLSRKWGTFLRGRPMPMVSSADKYRFSDDKHRLDTGDCSR